MILNMLWYSYIIFIVTNVIILQFLSAWFVHPDGAAGCTNQADRNTNHFFFFLTWVKTQE